jgi:hypothetical protein
VNVSINIIVAIAGICLIDLCYIFVIPVHVCLWILKMPGYMKKMIKFNFSDTVSTYSLFADIQ